MCVHGNQYILDIIQIQKIKGNYPLTDYNQGTNVMEQPQKITEPSDRLIERSGPTILSHSYIYT